MKNNCEYCNKQHENDNTGCNNSGDLNSGNRNSGYRNSGNLNSGDLNSGWFNTNEPKMRFFNKDSNVTYSEFTADKMVYPDLEICAWVETKDLPKDEVTESVSQMGGKLIAFPYKDAWKKYWDKAPEEDREWFKNLPNFDPDIFEEITSIKVSEPEEMISIDGKKWSKSTIKEALKKHAQ